MNKRVIFHIDMDAFFASCIQVSRPELKGKAIVVSGQSNKSIISTASYEARAYGIKSAMAMFQARKLKPDIIAVNADMEFFSKISKSIWQYIKTYFCDWIEISSIDEAYLDVTDFWKEYGSVNNMASVIQQAIYDKFNLTCSIGVSFNKFAAKMSTDLNKPFGITITSPDDFKNKIWPIKIENMFGVGNSMLEQMKKMNIISIGDLANKTLDEIYEKLGNFGVILRQNALGLGNDYVLKENSINKSISKEITLSNPTNQIEQLEEIIFSLTTKVINKMKSNKLIGKTIDIKLRYRWNNLNHESFNKTKHLHSKRKQITIGEYTDNFEKIYSNALICFNNIFDNSKEISLIGVGVGNLINKNEYGQQITLETLLDYTDTTLTKKEIEELIYKMNKKIGKNSLTTANNIKTKKKDD